MVCVKVCIAYRSPAGREFALQALAEQGLEIESFLLDGSASFDAKAYDLVLLEGGAAKLAIDTTASIANAGHVLVVVALAEPPGDSDLAELLRAGACGAASSVAALALEVCRAKAIASRMHHAEKNWTQSLGRVQQHDRLHALGMLAAGVGHEINNPAGAVMANLQALREDFDSIATQDRQGLKGVSIENVSSWREAVCDCLIGVRQIAEVVRTLRSMSQATTDAEREDVDVNLVASNVCRFLSRELLSAHITVTLALQPDLPLLLGRTAHFYQIVTNLMINAIQAMSEVAKDGEITISSRQEDNLVVFCVADNGPGVAPDAVSKIFDPFFTTKDHVGTGLGLFITQNLVRQMGGEIMVENRPGQGATFLLTFESQQGSPSVPTHTRYPDGRARLRVLVVDDEELILRALGRSLKLHFEVVTANSAARALELIETDGVFDAVVCDVVMPGQDGLTLYTTVSERYPKLAATWLFVSGGIANTKVDLRVTATGRPLLRKPLEQQELLDALEAMTRTESVGGAAR